VQDLFKQIASPAAEVDIDLHVAPRPLDPFAMDVINSNLLRQIRSSWSNTNKFFASWESHAAALSSLVVQKLNFTTPASVSDLADSLLPRLCHGKRLPCRSDDATQCLSGKEAQQLVDAAAWRVFWEFGYGQSNQAHAGLFLKQVLDNTSNKTKQVFTYAVHETTLMALLGAFQSDDMRWPAYAASVAIEIWQPKDNTPSSAASTFVRFIRNGKVMRLPWCSHLYECPLHEFQRHTARIVDFAYSQ
jgi:hypothetical protein